jgi:hypothetical protein
MGHKITTTHHTIGYAERYSNSDNGEPNSWSTYFIRQI